MRQPHLLISGRPVAAFTPEEYHKFVCEMYAVRMKRGAKPPSPAEGLTLRRTKTGKISIARRKVARAFDYVTRTEVEGLAKYLGASQAEVWNAFKAKKYIIADSRLEAEQIHSDIQGITW